MKDENNQRLVAVFNGSPWEAEVIKGLLKSNEVNAMIKDGILGTLAPYLAPEVSVMVNEDDYEAAVEVIKSRSAQSE